MNYAFMKFYQILANVHRFILTQEKRDEIIRELFKIYPNGK
jgi:hypothetical protein